MRFMRALRLLTVKEASSFLQLHANTVYKWSNEGKLPHSRINGTLRFSKADLEKYITADKSRTYQANFQRLPKRNGFCLSEFDRINLKGDSALAKQRRRWCFGRKGVFQRKLKSGYSWCFWFYDEQGNLKKVTVPEAICREDAIAALEAIVHEVRRKKLKIRSITLRDFAAIFMLKYSIPHKKSSRTDQGFFDNHLVPYFGDLALTEITPEHVSDFVVQKRKEGAKGSTINKQLQVLSRMFTVARKFGYETSENPVDRQLHFSDESRYRRDRVLSHDEEMRLMQKAAAHIRLIIQCALLQGLRLQEILTLRISDLDLHLGTINIRPENNKTGKLDTIPIRNEMKAEFERLIVENNGRSPFVFNYEDPGTGAYRAVTTIRRSFREACRRAGIEGLQFRDLRRTCSTRLHEAGVDPLLISRLLRHSSMKISTEVYIQSSLKLMKKALAEVDTNASKGPDHRINWNRFRTRDEDGTEAKNVTCLFSMN